MEMKERKKIILKAIIDDYIHFAQPIGSRAITEKYGLGLSPATIRIEMSGLEEMGYLEQPHVSAGRVPSDKAYRLYVDRLMDAAALSDEDTALIRKYMKKRAGELGQMAQRVVEALSRATECVAVALTPQAAAAKIQSVRLVPVASNKALVIAVTDGGIIKDSVIRIPEGITEDVLYVVSQMLSAELSGRTSAEAVRIAAELTAYAGELPARLINEFSVALKDKLQRDESGEVLLDGASNIFKFPEYNDIGRAKLLLSVLENKPLLQQMLKKAPEASLNAVIGEENEHEEMADCSVITASFSLKDIRIGTFGIIGPTRLDYARVFAVLDLLNSSFGDAMQEEEESQD